MFIVNQLHFAPLETSAIHILIWHPKNRKGCTSNILFIFFSLLGDISFYSFWFHLRRNYCILSPRTSCAAPILSLSFLVRHGSYLKYKQLLNKIIKKTYSVNVHMLISLLHHVVKFDLYIKTRKKTSTSFPWNKLTFAHNILHVK